MTDFATTYLKRVHDGIANAVVTAGGKELSLNEGLTLWAERVFETREREGLVFFCGNGASATMSEHMSSDWFMNAKVNTATVAETSLMTALSNDFSYEEVFAYKVDRVCTEGDVLVTVSSSGNSPNVVRALETARKKKAFCITVSGMKADNRSRALGDLNFYVPLDYYGMVESAHAAILHAALDCFLDKYMGGIH